MSKLAGYWLLSTAGGVGGLILWGNYVRLRKAGGTVSEWDLRKYPSTEAQWEREYMRFKDRRRMGRLVRMQEFKELYFIDWLHRASASALGLYFSLPLLFFWSRGSLQPSLKPTLFLTLSLAGLQALSPTWLPRDPYRHSDLKDSEHIRMAEHRWLGLTMFGLMLWGGMKQLGQDNTAFVRTMARKNEFTHLRHHYQISLILLAASLASGALVSSSDSGRVVKNWPWYGESWLFPVKGFKSLSLMDSFVESREVIQFTHRTLAYLAAFSVVKLWRTAENGSVGKGWARGAAGLVGLQLVLGILTLIRDKDEQKFAHQGLGITLLTCLLIGMHGVRAPLNIKRLI